MALVPGAAVTAIVTTALSSVDGEAGVLRYRGVSFDEFASYAEAVSVVVDGKRGDRGASLVAARVAAVDVGASVYAALRAAIAGTAACDDIVEFAGACGRAVSRLRGRFVDGGSYAARVLGGIADGDVDDDDVSDFDRCLIVHLDHALNPGTLCVRVAASTGAPLSSSLTAGLCALEGPLHGGASSDVGRVLDEIGDAAQTSSWLAQQKSQKKKVPGFGHPIYLRRDPRSSVLRALCERAADRRGDHRFVDVAVALDEAVRAAHPQLFPNVDFYAAALYATLGVPRALHTACFFAARVVGWAAHHDEQRRRGRIISPEAAYDGAPARPLSAV